MEINNRILVTGDFCPINRVENLINEGNYEAIYNDFLSLAKGSALAITNIECPLTEAVHPMKKIGPSLKISKKAAEALSFAGFNLVTLANNHIMDYGAEGLSSTIEACEKQNIDTVGAGKDYESAREIAYRMVGEQKVAILNFAENEFSTTDGDHPGANPLCLVNNFNDIKKARANSDHVLVIVHGGHEMYDLPSPRVKRTFRFFADAGASVVIGHHTHCYSGYEVYNGVPIFYSLGNFIFDYPGKKGPDWNRGYAIGLSFDRKVEFIIIPYLQCDYNPGVKLIDANDRIDFDQNIQRLNNIISDDNLLRREFENYCHRVRSLYLSHIEPHSFRFLHYLRNRHLFPSFLSKKKKILYLNLIRCESHREVLSYLIGGHI